MSSRPPKETGPNIVGSISEFSVAYGARRVATYLARKARSVENLVENGHEVRAQALDRNCRRLSPPQRFAGCMSLNTSYLLIISAMSDRNAIVNLCLKDNLHRNVAISNVRVY